jgi:hypothetical protein
MANQEDWGVRGATLTQPPFAGPNDPAIVIFPDPIPVELVAYYAAEVPASTVIAVIITRKDADSYVYQALITNAIIGMALAVGVRENNVSELYRIIPADLSPQIIFGRRETGTVEIDGLLLLSSFFSPAELRIDTPAVAFTIDGVSAPRVFLGANSTNLGTVATSGGAGGEVAVPSASWNLGEPTFNFVNGRVYEVYFGAYLHYTGTPVVNVKLRKGAASTTGTLLGLLQFIGHPAGALQLYTRALVKNNSGADVATKLSMTVQNFTGGASGSIYGDAAALCAIIPRDIGNVGSLPEALVSRAVQI